MALLNKNIQRIRDELDNIKKLIGAENMNANGSYPDGTISSCIDTFQYVTNQLNEWAGDTAIGQEIENEMKVLLKSLSDLLSTTDTLVIDINKFADNQQELNNGLHLG